MDKMVIWYESEQKCTILLKTIRSKPKIWIWSESLHSGHWIESYLKENKQELRERHSSEGPEKAHQWELMASTVAVSVAVSQNS